MLSLYAKQELERLQNQTNHSLTIDDFDDIEKLNDLCNAITSKESKQNDIVDMPVSIGCYELRQPTIGALEWYNDYYLPLFKDNPLLCDIGLAFSLSVCDPSELWALNNRRSARRTVKRFARRLKCTHEELQAVLKKLLCLSDEPSDGEGGNAGALVAMLCKEYGHSPRYWLWEAPVGMINAFVDDYVQRVELQQEQLRNSTTGANKPPPAESRVKKFNALREHTNMMRDKWLKM